MMLKYTECEVPAEWLYIIFHPKGKIFHDYGLENQMYCICLPFPTHLDTCVRNTRHMILVQQVFD